MDDEDTTASRRRAGPARPFASLLGGLALAAVGGAATLAQVISWLVWGFDAPPTGWDVVIAGALPGTVAMLCYAAAVALLRKVSPEEWGWYLGIAVLIGILVPIVFGIP